VRGVQHALLVSARNVLGLKEADHAEINPDTDVPLLQRMECSLVEKSQRIVVVSGTQFGQFYRADSGVEDYRCSYGLNRKFEHLLHREMLEIVARSNDGRVRAVALARPRLESARSVFAVLPDCRIDLSGEAP